MKTVRMLALVFALVLGLGQPLSRADDFPENVDFETLATFPFAVEGLTGDTDGNLYTTERAGNNPCLVKRINFATKTVEVVGNIPAPCSPTGLAFDKNGFLFIANPPDILKLNPAPSGAGPGPAATPFVTGLVPGANGVAFDRHGNLWTGDGTAGLGRVWKITTGGAVTEEFRVQPMATTNLEIGASFGTGQVLGSGVNSVGRDARTLPPGTIDANRLATNNAGSQPLVANGLAFDEGGDLFIADTARGAIWKVKFKRDGNLEDRQTGCDIVFTRNTLCLKNVYVAHPFLEGTDGIALDKKGNIWNSANERNAIVVVTKDKTVIEIFRNEPDGTTHLRNTGPLEFPTSPFLLGKNFCTANSDGNRRDNSPAASTMAGINVGELGGLGQPLGKISCMNQNLKIEGLPLPVK